jgi:osmotically-inducible protein OsmY
VTTERGTVTLDGLVNAWRERRIAERAAWNAPGVTAVKDNLALA